MAMRRTNPEPQGSFWIEAERHVGPRHVFYDRLNSLLSEASFDRRVEDLVEPYYDRGGRLSIPPGRYFRMLFVGYFEGIDSQRGIAWRCEDSLSLQRFLKIDVGAGERVPDHSSLTRIGQRYPAEVYAAVFAIVLEVCRENKLLGGANGDQITAGVDSTLLEANAAMKAIVRKDEDGNPTTEDWNDYIRRLMVEEGQADSPDDPTDEEVRRFDRKRSKKNGGQGRRTSNREWVSPVDPDARITKMKDGRTHLAYKAEHVIDLQSEVILAAEITEPMSKGEGSGSCGIASDVRTIVASITAATENIERSGGSEFIHEVVADKGYHSQSVLSDFAECETRTYIPERKANTTDGKRKWTGKSAEQRAAFRNNHERLRRPKNKRLQRLRSERVERSFAHLCDSGGSRRSWLRGVETVKKRYQMAAAARNLGLVLRALFGAGTPRELAATAWRSLARFWPGLTAMLTLMLIRWTINRSIQYR